jgi:hypothetical protein
MDYFVIAEVVDADRFRLIAPQPDGSSIQKSGIFKAEQRRSWLPVNLLPRTLTQVPLLRVGHQTIQYILTKDGRSVEEGYFQVRVFKENPKTCPSKSMTPVLPGECEDASNAVCDRFFQECLSTF